jgi:hypothetical protein
VFWVASHPLARCLAPSFRMLLHPPTDRLTLFRWVLVWHAASR